MNTSIFDIPIVFGQPTILPAGAGSGSGSGGQGRGHKRKREDGMASKPKRRRKANGPRMVFMPWMDDPTTDYWLGDCFPEFAEAKVPFINSCMDQVVEGKRPFGRSVVLPNFKPKEPALKVPNCVTVVMMLHVLYSRHVCHTAQGFMSLFPVTVYGSAANQRTRSGGFPAMVFFPPQLRMLMGRLYRANSNHMSKFRMARAMDQHLNCLCRFDVPKGSPVLTSMTGFDPRSNKKDFAQYAVISARWYASMKPFFVRDDGTVRPIMETYRLFYPQFAEDFADERACVIVGVAQEPSVTRMCGEACKSHTHSFCRNRAIADHIDDYDLKDLSQSRMQNVHYTDASYGYGCSVWRPLLEELNSAFLAINGYQADKKGPYHMVSYFMREGVSPVLDRTESLQALNQSGKMTEGDEAGTTTAQQTERRRVRALPWVVIGPPA